MRARRPLATALLAVTLFASTARAEPAPNAPAPPASGAAAIARAETAPKTLAPPAPSPAVTAPVAPRPASGKDGGETYRQLDTFTRVLAYIENNYVEEVPEDQLVAGAIKGMVSTLDPHTVFMPPEVFKDIKNDTRGEFGGVGIELTNKVTLRNGARVEQLTVVAPIDDTPAARAGIRSGDVILKLDGEPTGDMDLMTAVARMRGPPGSRIILTIQREGFSEPRDIELVRDRIRIVSVEARLYAPYAYVKVKNFQDNTDRFLKRALDDLRKENKGELKGLILDLRNNPGGLLEQAVRVSDRFLSGGLTIVTTKGRGGRRVEEEKSHDRDTEPNYPIIILVNGGSASASEIVAGALQDHGRAVIMGTQTFGKGSVQTLIELEDGSGLKLTVARYFTPKGRSIQEKGITPDVAVKDPAADENSPREADLKNHFRNDFETRVAGRGPDGGVSIREVRESNEKAAAPQQREDFVLKTALDYLRSWDIFRAGRSASGQ